MNRKSRLISAGCLLAAIFSCWYLLNPANARWLKIERSPVAVPGQNFKVRVILTKADPGLYLGADLHGITSDGLSTGYLCGARQVKVTAGTNVYEFSIPVPMNKKIFYLFPVIILSRDGTWQGRILTAHGETVTLCPHCSPDQYIKPEPAAAHETEYRAAEKKSASRATGIATALAWIIAAITAAFPGKVKVSRAITAVALVSFLWEVLNSSSMIAHTLRIIAEESGLYGARRIPQQILAVAVIIILAAAAAYLISSEIKMNTVVAVISISVYWAVSSLKILSLHETDLLLEADIAGTNSGQLVKLAAAILCLSAGLIRIKTVNNREKS